MGRQHDEKNCCTETPCRSTIAGCYVHLNAPVCPRISTSNVSRLLDKQAPSNSVLDRSNGDTIYGKCRSQYTSCQHVTPSHDYLLCSIVYGRLSPLTVNFPGEITIVAPNRSLGTTVEDLSRKVLVFLRLNFQLTIARANLANLLCYSSGIVSRCMSK